MTDQAEFNTIRRRIRSIRHRVILANIKTTEDVGVARRFAPHFEVATKGFSAEVVLLAVQSLTA